MGRQPLKPRFQFGLSDIVVLVFLAGGQGWLLAPLGDAYVPRSELMWRHLAWFFYGNVVALGAGYLSIRYTTEHPCPFWKRVGVLLGLDLMLLALPVSLVFLVLWAWIGQMMRGRSRSEPEPPGASGDPPGTGTPH